MPDVPATDAPFDANAAVTSYLNDPTPDAGPALKNSIAGALDTKPDYEAELRKASVTTGVPLAAARGDADYVTRNAKMLNMGLDGLVEGAPQTASFLSDPDNAKIAHDDVGPLQATEHILGNLKRSLYGASLLSGLQSTAAIPFRMLDAGITLNTPWGFTDDDQARLNAAGKLEGLPPLPQYPSWMKQKQIAHFSLPGITSEADYNAKYGSDPKAWRDNQWMMWQANAAEWLQKWSGDTMKDADPAAQTHLSKTYDIFTNGKFTDPNRLAELDPVRMGADVVQNLPTIAAMIFLAKGAGAAGGEAALSAEAGGADAAAVQAAKTQAAMKYLASRGAVTEGAIGYAQQANQTYEETKGIAASQPPAEGSEYQTLLRAGFEPEIAQAIVADHAATKAGVAAGLVDSGVNFIGGAVLGHIIGEGGGLVARMAKGMATEGITEGVQSGGEQIGQNTAEQRAVDPSISTFKDVQGQVLQGAAVGGFTGSSMAGIAGRAHHQAEAADDAMANAHVMANLANIAQASKLAARDTATFQGFIADAAKDGPVQDVWISAEGLKQSGVNPADLIAAAPAVASQINEAKDTGGDIRIPVEQFATLPPELSQTLIPHLKTDPTGMSQTEAETFMQNFGPELKANVEQVIADSAKRAADQVSTDKVRDQVLEHLTTANRFTSDVNGAYADLTATFYATQAQRLGMSAEDLYAQHPVQIAAQGVESGSLNTHVEQRADYADTPEFKAWFGKSTTHDGAGDPQTYFHGTRSDFAAFDRVDGGNAYGDGHYFTDNPKLASDYAVGENVNRMTLEGNAHPNVVPVYLKIEKPFDMAEHGRNAPTLPKASIDELENAANELEPGAFKKGELGQAFDRSYPATAPNVYQWLHEQGLDSNAVLRKAGYDGLHTDHGTIVFDPKQVKSIFNGGDFDPNNPDLLAQNDGQPRGSYNPASNIITLLRGADLSTFLHESGHFYLETLARIAADPNSPAEMRDDMAKAMGFMGHGDMTPAEWLSQPLDARREGHELFARGFEQYLMEGKAPSQELRGLFQRFRSWLTAVYKQLTALRVQITPDVRGVFDRMLATQEQIDENEKAKSYGLMPDLQGHMTPDEWAEYQRLGAQATQDAVDNLESKSLRDMQWLSGARDRTIRRLQREANSKRKAIRTEVEAEVMAEPINQARTFLKHGLLDGQEQEGPTKLSLPDLRETYGEAPSPVEEATGQKLLKVDYRKLGYGKYGMLAEDGLSPDHVAELFGFTSGDHLINELLHAEAAADKIHGVTDQRMLERYGDLADADAIEKAADEAVHNDARLRFVATEANALAKAVGKRKVLASAARSFAAEMIGRLKVRDIKPARYSTAETRAAVNAEKAAKAGKLVEAATEKRNQLINGYAARAAYDALDEVDKAVRYFGRFDNAGTRKGLDPEYRDQIDALLERFEFKPSTTLKEIERRKSLAKWVEAQQAKGYDPIIPDDLLNEAYRVSYKDMALDDLRGLVDSVKNIAHLGRLKTRLLTAKDARDFASTVDESAALIIQNATGKVKTAIEHNRWIDKTASGVREFFASHRKFASLIRQMGGFEDQTVLWDTLVRPMNAAGDHEATMTEASTIALHKLFTPILGDKLRQKVYVPEIGSSLSLEGRLAVALNWGNDGNRARVMDGDNWSQPQVNAILKTLEPRHFAFVQGMWDHINSFKDEIRAKERRVTGVEPEFVEPSPFTVEAADGSSVDMRGGYYPIKYDPERSGKADADNIADIVKQSLMGAYTRATTRRGHLQARVDKVERPIRKDLGVSFEHITQVIHDLSWHEYLIDANRLLGASQIDGAIRDHYGPEVLRTMKSAVQDMAAGSIPAANVFERSVNYLRSGATVAGLGWNLMTSLQQPLGLFNGAARVGPKWVAMGAAKWLGDAAQMQNTVGWVNEKSDFMRLRSKTFQREIHEVRSKVMAGAKPAVMTAVEGSFYYMITKAQMVADMPTWLGAYEKSMARDTDESLAIAQADQAVRDSQGGGQIADLAAIQRGGPLMKLWTNFYSYFNVVYNQLAESVGETRLKGPKHLPFLASDVMLTAILPSVLGTVITGLVRGDDWDQLPKQIGQDGLGYMFGMMVGLRDIGGIITSDGRQSAPAGTRFLGAAADLYKQVEQGQTDEAFFKAANTMGGILFHYPAAQVQRTVLGIEALASGQTQNPLAILSGPPRKPKP
jgi:hypothetical protein